MNALFPGDPQGSVSKRIAHVIFNLVKGESSFLLDLHSGGEVFAIHPYVICHVEGKSGPMSEALGRAYGVGPVLRTSKRDGWVKGTLYAEATAAGVPGIIGEAGGETRLREQDVLVHQRGIFNILRYLKMLSGPVERAKELLLLSLASDGFGDYSTTSTSGLLNLNVTPGALVKKGQLIGKVLSPSGELVETLLSPRDGIITDLRTHPLVRESDSVAFVLKIDSRIGSGSDI
jgi:predicted deacylase